MYHVIRLINLIYYKITRRTVYRSSESDYDLVYAGWKQGHHLFKIIGTFNEYILLSDLKSIIRKKY
jgi:hypothetical protein